MNKTFLLCFHNKNYLRNLLKDFYCDYALNKYEAYSKLIAKDYNAIFISEKFLLNNNFLISIFINELCSSKLPLIVISENCFFLPDLISVRKSDLPKVLHSFTEEFLEPVNHDETDVFKNVVIFRMDTNYDIIYKMSDNAMYEVKRLEKNNLVVCEL